MQIIFDAVKQISIETGKAEEMVIDALYDFGVIDESENDTLVKMLEEQ